MNDTSANERNEIICHCSGTRKTQLLALIQQGEDSVEKLSYRTGAAAGCGACEPWIEALLQPTE